MKNIEINIRKLSSGENFVPVEFTQQFSHTGNEFAEDTFIEESIEASINSIEDYEKVRFTPSSGITEIHIELMLSGSTPITYDYFGYTNDDIKFRRNKFKKSFLRFSFFDSANPTRRKLAFQNTVFNQLNTDQRDINGNLLDVSLMPVTYKILNPFSNALGTFENYYLFWLANPQNTYPINFFTTITYNNAIDGKSQPFVSFDGQIPIAQLNQLNYLKYRLIKMGGQAEYTIDTLNRDVQISGTTLTIKLYPLKTV
jgi:hypothetical protein